MSTIEEAREQARAALANHAVNIMETDYWCDVVLAPALRALLDATERDYQACCGLPEPGHAHGCPVYGTPIEQPEAQEAAEPLRDADGDMTSSGEHRKISMSGDSFFVCDTCTNVLGLNVRWDHASKREDHQAAVESLPDKPAEDEREALTTLISATTYQAAWGECVRAADAILAAGYSKRPRPITDEMVAAADFAIMPYWGERYPSGSLTTEIARAALEAAEAARR